MNDATSEEIGPLGPKDFAGVDKKYLAKMGSQPSATVVTTRRKGQSVAMQPDLVLPDGADLKTEKLFPVKILRGYRPMSERFEIGEIKRNSKGEPLKDEAGNDIMEYVNPPEILPGQDAGFLLKLDEGEYARLPISEARLVIKRGIAERNDEMAA